MERLDTKRSPKEAMSREGKLLALPGFSGFLDGLLKYFSALLLVIKGHVESGIQKDLEDIVCRKHKQWESVVPAISEYCGFQFRTYGLKIWGCSNQYNAITWSGVVLQVDLFSDLFSCHLPQAVMENYLLKTVCPEQGKC